MMNASIVALPKTYHHFASRGTRCFIGGPSKSEMPRRLSSQFQVDKMRRFIFSKKLLQSRRDRDRRRFDLHLVVVHPDLEARERFRRRTGRHTAVLVISATVTRAKKQLGVRHPAHRTAEVRAVCGKSDELILARP